MKILYLTGQIKYHGGIEKVLSMKMNYLADNLKQDVFLLTYEQGNNPFIYPVSCNIHHEDLNINYDVAIRHKGMFSPTNLKKGIKHIFLLRKKIKLINPDVIILPNGGFDYMSLPYLVPKKKIIREMHSSLYIRDGRIRSIKEKLRLKMDLFFEKKYSYIVVLNNIEEKFIRNDHIISIPNPIFLPDYKRPNLDSFMAVTAGRICPIKGYDRLIKAWGFVVKKIPSAILHIYGTGDNDYIEYIREIISKENMKSHVLLMGEVPELTNILSKYSLFLSSSQTECFPMVFLEAMSCGLPVISFDCPTGPRCIISNLKNGFLVEDQNIEDLSKKVVLYFISKRKDEMSISAYETAKKFGIAHIMEKWMTLFNK